MNFSGAPGLNHINLDISKPIVTGGYRKRLSGSKAENENLELLGNGRAWVRSTLPKKIHENEMLCMRKIDLKTSIRIIFDREFEFLIANNPIDFKNMQIKKNEKFKISTKNCNFFFSVFDPNLPA